MASPVTDHRYGFVWSNSIKTPVTAATTVNITLAAEECATFFFSPAYNGWVQESL